MGANDEPPELPTALKGVSEKEVLGPNTLEKLIWAGDIACNLWKVDFISLAK